MLYTRGWMGAEEPLTEHKEIGGVGGLVFVVSNTGWVGIEDPKRFLKTLKDAVPTPEDGVDDYKWVLLSREAIDSLLYNFQEYRDYEATLRTRLLDERKEAETFRESVGEATEEAVQQAYERGYSAGYEDGAED